MKVEVNKINQSLEEIAGNVGALVKGDKIMLPPQVGDGYYKQYLFSDHFKVVIVNCSFKEKFHFIRTPLTQEKHTLVLRFHNIFTSVDNDSQTENSIPPSIYITTEGIGSEVVFMPGEKIQNIIISIDAEYLIDLLQPGRVMENEALKELLSNRKPFLFEELMTPKIHAIVNEIEEAEDSEKSLHIFYCQIKAMELIYCFLDEFLKRESVTYNPINKKDIEIIYSIRDTVLRELSVVPVLSVLAQQYGISETKMKKLFKQVFGLSIYQYYQQFRIQKAAALIRERGCSVSEAGYQTGFTNMSHFARLFKRYMGEKPKKYSQLLMKK